MDKTFIISGAQIEEIKASIRQRSGMHTIKKLQRIEEDQFLMESDKDLFEDIARIQQLLNPKEEVKEEDGG